MPRSAAHPPRLLRAALLGLGAGCGIGALTLFLLTRRVPDCAGRPDAECALQAGALAELSHYQGLFALGLLALAGGIFVWLWSRREGAR